MADGGSFVNKAVPLAHYHSAALEWAQKVIAGSYQILDYDLAVAWEGAMSAQPGQLVGESGSRAGGKAFMDKQYRPDLEALDFSEAEWG